MGVGHMYKNQTQTKAILGGYDSDDGLCSYTFNFTDRLGTHVIMSFQAEPEYDLSVVFQQFQKFLLASGHNIEGEVGELYYDEEPEDEWVGQPEAQVQQPRADNFSMDHLPNNGWPFGGLTTTSLAPISVTDLGTMTTHSYSDWAKLGQLPTMAPLTQEQVRSWTLDTKGIQSLTSADLQSWTSDMPGTAGGAKVKF